MTANRLAIVAAALALGLAHSAARAAIITIFDNQFNNGAGNSWSTSDGATDTYTPNNVGDTFANVHDAIGATWTVAILTPQPWNVGGVIFTGGPNTTGQMFTTFATVNSALYTVAWDVDLLGAATTTNLIASVDDTGSSQILSSTTADGTFTFTGNGGAMTLRIGVNSVGANASSDVYVDYVTVTYDSESVPAPAALPAGLGLVALVAARRRR